MRRLLLAALLVVAVIDSADAAPPVLRNIPDILIGDEEDNGTTDMNLFEFREAFRFDDYVVSADVETTALLWSYDELDITTPTEAAYSVNGKAPLHLREIGPFVWPPADHPWGINDHINPAPEFEVRSGNEYATFRDLILSPTDGTAPFPDPTSETMREITFYVSDGTTVGIQQVAVLSIDNTFDELAGGTIQPPPFTDTFDTQSDAWGVGGQTAWDNSLNVFSFNQANGAYVIRVFPSPDKYRMAFWYGNRPTWAPYTAVGSDRYLRGKFYIYATNYTDPAEIPNFQVKLQNRFAVTSALMIQTHDGSTTDTAFYQELRPSSDPSNPSLYRVDLDPIDIPFLSTNTNAAGEKEGMQASVEAFCIYPEANGSIGFTELELGVYPITALGTAIATQVYDVPLLTAAESIDILAQLEPAPAGVFPAVEATSATITNTPSGVLFDTTQVPTNRIAQIERLFYAGSDPSARMRCQPGEQYVISWHITSTRATSEQGWIWLNARTAKFGYSQFLILAGGQTSGTGRGIAQQSLPGIGSLNPDDTGGPNTEPNGGWYTMLMTTPLHPQIRPESALPMSEKMPLLMSQPGRGENVASPYRDIRLHSSAYDTLSPASAGTHAEAALFTIDRIEVKAYPLLSDTP